MSPRWKHRSVLILLPTNKNSWTRHQWENPRTRNAKMKYALHHKDQGWLPPSQYSVTQRGLPWAFSDIQTPEYCGSLPGSPYSGFTPQGQQGNLQDSTTGNLIVIGEVQILADCIGTCKAQVVAPMSSFVHLQNQVVMHSVTRELTGVQACLIWVLQKFRQPWNLVCPCPG